MTKILVVGKRTNTCYDVDFEMGPYFVDIKYDTGAVCTVISAKALDKTLT